MLVRAGIYDFKLKSCERGIIFDFINFVLGKRTTALRFCSRYTCIISQLYGPQYFFLHVFSWRCQFVFFSFIFWKFPGRKTLILCKRIEIFVCFELLRHPLSVWLSCSHNFLSPKLIISWQSNVQDTLVNMFVCVGYLVSEHYMNNWFQVSWPQVQNEMEKSSVDP